MEKDLLINLLKKVPQHTRTKRHIRTILSHSTPTKLANLFRIEIERKLRRTKVSGYPYYIVIDPCNICNLKCPLCPTGLGENGRPPEKLDFETFKVIIDKLEKYAYEVALHNWGESLLNPEIFKMIEYISKKNIGTNLSSNLNIVKNIMKDDWADRLVKSGLEYLVTSLDGTDQKAYSKYRVKGNFDNVIENIKKIVAAKKRLKSKTPVIEWQFIIMKHNIHQVEKAMEMVDEIGVDLIRFIPPGLPMHADNKKELGKEWFPEITTEYDSNDGYREDMFLQKPQNGPCFYLYRSITINPIGDVAPCCVGWKEEDDFANILKEDLDTIWNNKYYISARNLFSHEKPISETPTLCNRCGIFNKYSNKGSL